MYNRAVLLSLVILHPLVCQGDKHMACCLSPCFTAVLLRNLNARLRLRHVVMAVGLPTFKDVLQHASAISTKIDSVQ